MVRWLQIFALALLTLFGLVACSATADTQSPAVNSVAQTRPTVTPFPTPAPPTIEPGTPAFLTSYADWGPICTANEPIVYGLRDEFGDAIQFIWLNVDSAITLPLREQYGIVHRTNYVLVDATGAVHSRWFGYLNDDELSAALQTFLNEQS